MLSSLLLVGLAAFVVGYNVGYNEGWRKATRLFNLATDDVIRKCNQRLAEISERSQQTIQALKQEHDTQLRYFASKMKEQ